MDLYFAADKCNRFIRHRRRYIVAHPVKVLKENEELQRYLRNVSNYKVVILPSLLYDKESAQIKLMLIAHRCRNKAAQLSGLGGELLIIIADIILIGRLYAAPNTCQTR